MPRLPDQRQGEGRGDVFRFHGCSPPPQYALSTTGEGGMPNIANPRCCSNLLPVGAPGWVIFFFNFWFHPNIFCSYAKGFSQLVTNTLVLIFSSQPVSSFSFFFFPHFLFTKQGAMPSSFFCAFVVHVPHFHIFVRISSRSRN